MPFWKKKKDEPVYVDAWPPALPVQPRFDTQTGQPLTPAHPAPVAAPTRQPARPELVSFQDNGAVSLNVSGIPEAKLAIKQLRLQKKEVTVEKKTINAELAEIRAKRRQKVRTQGSKMRGGGDLGKTVRAFQSVGRDLDRSRHANRISPYEQAKAALDERSIVLDRAIHTLEAYILEQEG